MSADQDVKLINGGSVISLPDGRVECRMSDNTVIVMAYDVYCELTDDDYSNRQHYSRATYAKGCHGPMCRLAETHRGRKRNEERAQEEGREYREGYRANDRSEELAPIITWHLHTRGRKIRTA